MQEIIIIAAMSKNRVIGFNNNIPWSIKEDMIHFKKLTYGWPCIMGRKTWDSLPKKPLPGRLNLIVSNSLTKSSFPKTDNIIIAPSLSAAIGFCSGYEKIFICGGEMIYKQALLFADKIVLTLVHKFYQGDTFLPEIDSSCWDTESTADFDTFSIITYTRNKNFKKEQI